MAKTGFAAQESCCPVLELRQYRVHQGRRDELIELFERELVESQEEVGMRLVGQFRDLDHPDRFVWVRGFAGMEARARALADFYDGPVWGAHRDAANATILDSDDVLLLRPAGPGTGLRLPVTRPPAGAAPLPAQLVVATIYPLACDPEDFATFFDQNVRPLMIETGGRPTASLVTEPAENTFPRLPVRTGESVFVWFACFEADAHPRHRERLRSSPEWAQLQAAIDDRLSGPPVVLRLAPTARSLLGRPAAPGTAEPPTGDVRDFDFLAGHWTVRNRRLRRRGIGCQEWDEFGGEHRGWPLLGGMANVDEMVCSDFSGLTLRVFDPGLRRWSIYWVSSRDGLLTPPVVGGFHGDTGEFIGEDMDGEQPVAVRFLWDRMGPGAARWEQAFSYDGGPWETNWIMDFRRCAPSVASAE